MLPRRTVAGSHADTLPLGPLKGNTRHGFYSNQSTSGRASIIGASKHNQDRHLASLGNAPKKVVQFNLPEIE